MYHKLYFYLSHVILLLGYKLKLVMIYEIFYQFLITVTVLLLAAVNV